MGEAEASAGASQDTSEVAEDDPLPRWARICAGIVGISLTGAGGVAVFKTDNQAGCVTLILAGTVFLLMAFGGAPLHSLGYGEANLRFARKRRDQAVRHAIESTPEQAPEVLSELEAVTSPTRPDATLSALTEHVYDNAIAHRISNFLPPGASLQRAVPIGPRGRRADFVIETESRPNLVIEARYTKHGNPATADMLEQAMAYSEVSGAPVLVVSNTRLTAGARNYLRRLKDSGESIRFVQWIDDGDNEELRLAMTELLDT
ncbi:hypothetical protein [Streptomyces sp. NPDC012616]|uniref:hypothetical protein n=1 Tax=Streptomyces sp. NPDC012616 TaxID=3364840 RepID=UPI0036EAA16D